MEPQVKFCIDSCAECLLSDKKWKLMSTPLHPVPFPDRVWEKVGLDFSGPYDVLPHDLKFLILMVDYHSK